MRAILDFLSFLALMVGVTKSFIKMPKVERDQFWQQWGYPYAPNYWQATREAWAICHRKVKPV